MLHKILKIVALLLSVAGIFFLGRIIVEGDDEIKAAALAGDTAIVDPIAIIAYITLGIVLLFVVVFVLKNLFTNTSGLKNTLIGVGAFAAVLIISYVISVGPDESFLKGLYKSGDTLATESESKLVGGGLIAFYVLIVIAAVAMIFSGVKKTLSK
ncbi:MAG: hypothetical protein CMC05_07355 [Flavobacteriaceae bacterium]|nr:hypothetical protein [Flavobacteriaceae bacterium]MBD10194.1 hypothetical protein [Flavobacteriaceae bacterium]|tara:strand:+ start:601 stop:1065 length:465 start_codon:yes stop_codon:yes gene_type:complete